MGAYAPQYDKALEIGDALVNATPRIPTGNLITVGQSLGGGLASAAAVSGDIPGFTFNAAGLHKDTLARDPVTHELLKDEFGQNRERFQGSFDRFDNAATLIKAYHTDYDILTFIQKTIIPMPNAAGLEIIPELDTPFDLVMTGNAAIIGAGIGSGQSWVATFGLINGGATMVEAHGHPSILYGLLLEEDNLGNIVKDALGYPVYFP